MRLGISSPSELERFVKGCPACVVSGEDKSKNYTNEAVLGLLRHAVIEAAVSWPKRKPQDTINDLGRSRNGRDRALFERVVSSPMPMIKGAEEATKVFTDFMQVKHLKVVGPTEPGYIIPVGEVSIKGRGDLNMDSPKGKITVDLKNHVEIIGDEGLNVTMACAFLGLGRIPVVFDLEEGVAHVEMEWTRRANKPKVRRLVGEICLDSERLKVAKYTEHTCGRGFPSYKRTLFGDMSGGGDLGGVAERIKANARDLVKLSDWKTAWKKE